MSLFLVPREELSGRACNNNIVKGRKLEGIYDDDYATLTAAYWGKICPVYNTPV